MSASSLLSYARSLARIAIRELRGLPGETLPQRRLVAERWGIRADPKRLAAYLRATGGTGIRKFYGPDALLPPLFSAVWEADLALQMLSDPACPPLRGGVIHLESEVIQLRPLSATDQVRCRLELQDVDVEPRGTRLRLLTRTWNGAGQLCEENATTLLARNRSEPSVPHETRDTGDPDDLPRWEQVARWQLRASHGRRYARASGDYNPIHLWAVTARPFGYSSPVLHGFCTAALAAHALIEQFCDGEPAALRRFQFTLRRPLLLPTGAVLEAARTSGDSVRFRVAAGEGKSHAEGIMVAASGG